MFQGGIAQAGSFLEKASEILQTLDLVAQFTQNGAGEALQAKQQIIQVQRGFNYRTGPSSAVSSKYGNFRNGV